MTVTTTAVVVKRQHKKPCHDCPWRRAAFPGWLGAMSPDEWARVAQSESTADCHTRKFNENESPRCAGLAVFRANIVKFPRDPDEMRLPGDTATVFASPQEFIDHHTKGWMKP